MGASKLATGLLTFLSLTRVPTRGGGGHPSSPQVCSPFSVRPVCQPAGVGGVQAHHRSAHLSQSDPCADPQGWGVSKLTTGLLTFLSPTRVPTRGGGVHPSSPQVCSPFSVRPVCRSAGKWGAASLPTKFYSISWVSFGIFWGNNSSYAKQEILDPPLRPLVQTRHVFSMKFVIVKTHYWKNFIQTLS